MTICIGIICEQGKKAVAISDRMLTGVDVQFEHPVPKIDSLSPNCIALTAGTALIHTDLFRRVVSKQREKAALSIQDVVQGVKAEFVETRRSLIEEQFFLPRGFTIEWFNENQQTLKDDTSA